MPSTKKKNKGKGQRAKKGGSGSKSERDKAVKAAVTNTKNEDDVAVVTRLVDATNISDGGPSCWICLEEGPDESGNDIVRNCACRGDSAGFVHLSCLIQYAEKKCHDEWALVVSRGRVIDEKFKDCWRRCPICNQVCISSFGCFIKESLVLWLVLGTHFILLHFNTVLHKRSCCENDR